MEPVHTGDRLDQVVALELLVDVEHRVAWFIEAGQEFVHDNQDIRRPIGAEVLDDVFLVVLSIPSDVFSTTPAPAEDWIRPRRYDLRGCPVVRSRWHW